MSPENLGGRQASSFPRVALLPRRVRFRVRFGICIQKAHKPDLARLTNQAACPFA
jgi:hypothetical protein